MYKDFTKKKETRDDAMVFQISIAILYLVVVSRKINFCGDCVKLSGTIPNSTLFRETGNQVDRNLTTIVGRSSAVFKYALEMEFPHCFHKC